jgi:predicted MFS family arabinose efflux permease
MQDELNTGTASGAAKWWTVLAGALGCAAGAGMVSSYVFGLFVKRIAADFDWNRSETTIGITCFYIAAGFGHLVLGSAIAKHSVRKPTLIFVCLFVAAIALAGALPASVLLFCLVFALMGFFGAAATAMPYGIAIAGWFDQRRGLAMALACSGSGVSALFMSRYANWLLQNFGWRGGYVGVALLIAAIALPGILFFLRDPPYVHHHERQATIGEIMTSGPTFWKISLPVFMISITLLGLITNLAPLVTDRGLTPAEAAGLLGILGGSSWVTRLGLGLFLDRIHVRYIAMTIFLLITAGALAIALGTSKAVLVGGAITLGFGMGSEADLVAYTVSRYFSPAQQGRAFGSVWIFWVWGAGIGVFFGSLSFDLTGSYNFALAAYVLLALGAAAIISRLGPYRADDTGSDVYPTAQVAAV